MKIGAFAKSLRNQFGVVAAFYGSLPVALFGHSPGRISIPEIRTKLDLPSSTEEALMRDFEHLGQDLKGAISKYKAGREQQA